MSAVHDPSLLSYGNERMDIIDETNTEGIDDITRRELPALFLSRNGKDRSDQECKYGKEESANHDFKHE